jgi:HlyD family type I secretion membrane fusion protein
MSEQAEKTVRRWPNPWSKLVDLVRRKPVDNNDPMAGDQIFDYQGTIVSGALALLIAFGGFFTWLGTAPLTKASVAPGVVKVLGERQSVQHLEGGIIEALLVEEGSRVNKGDTLIRLDPTQHLATREILEGRMVGLEASALRLRNERDGVTELGFPDDLVQRAELLGEQDILNGEARIYQSRFEALNGQRRILTQRKQRFRDEVAAYHSQLKSSEEQLGYINEELDAATIIYEKGIYEKPKYLALKRSVSQLEGQIGELQALSARTHQRIGETDLEIIDIENQWTSRAASELQLVSAEMLQVREQLESIDDILNRLEIVAPQSGLVVGLQYHTIGGVVGSGDTILDIVPADAALVIEASVKPEDIDVVTAGMECDVRLSAYSLRTTPAIRGKVLQVSADIFVDSNSQRSYYRTIIEVDSDELAALENVELYPGMPAEVFIKTGRRSAMEYLLEPILRSMQRSFRE